jgi:cytochrome P450
MQDTISAGTDTSAVTIEWTLSELLKNPVALTMATEELDRVVGRDRLPTEGDRLPYLQAVIKESMRMHPATPLLSPRRCRRDAVVGSYSIPAGTCVAVNVWAIGRDPSVWEEPNEFRPERFLDRSTVDVKGQDFELLPFGSGRRMCPGMGLALKIVQLTLSNLLHAFAWRLPDGMTVEELNMEESLRFTMPRTIPLEAAGEPKLPGHLYWAEPAP